MSTIVLKRAAFLLVAAVALSGCANRSLAGKSAGAKFGEYPVTVGAGFFFDDFSYESASSGAVSANGWDIRTVDGAPGVPGAKWESGNIDFIEDGETKGNRLLRLTARTDGSPEGTSHAEIAQQRKFYEGTYAARIYFSDAPKVGPDGDPLVETFFTITPLNYPMEETYGEIDFEYLPNSGWDVREPTLFLTTWETYQADPWKPVNSQKSVKQSLEGWHTFVVTVGGAKVKYFMDGTPLAVHGNDVYPETPMSINFNLWFIEELKARAGEDAKQESVYEQKVDWVYYAGNQALDATRIEADVKALREAGTARLDTVPEWKPDAAETSSPETATVKRPAAVDISKAPAVKIDGKLDEWKSAPVFAIDAKDQVVYEASEGSWNGTGDLSSLIYAGWTERGLYVAADVRDDRIVQNWTGDEMWQGDYVEIELDANLGLDYDSGEMSEDDYHLGLSPGNFGSVPAGIHFWSGLVSEELKKKIELKTAKTPKGYSIEAFFPAEVFGIPMVAGGEFGVNVNPSDCDDPEKIQKQMMSFTPERRYNDPTSFCAATCVE